MPICPSCGSEQSGSTAFCAQCGGVLDRPDTISTASQPGKPARVSVVAAPTAASEFGDIGQYLARRLLALLVDLIGVTLLIAVAVHHAVAQHGIDPNSSSAFFETLVYSAFTFFVYRCVAEAYAGTTLGKALFGLRVQEAEGGRVGMLRAIARTLFLPFDLALIGFVLALITPRHRRIGDFVAGTEVVNLRVGAIAPVVAAALLGSFAYLDYAYADGFLTAQSLSGDIERFGPGLMAGQPTPAPGPTPLPERTPVPTEQPITVPTIAPSASASASPSEAPSSEAPSSPPSPAAQPPPTT